MERAFKGPPKLPLISDLVVGEFLYRDHRRMSPEDQAEAAGSWEEWLQTIIVEQKPGSLGLCSNSEPQQEVYAKKMVASGMSPREYIVAHPYEPEDDSVLNPELINLTFGVYTGVRKKLQGLVNLYNVEVEIQDMGRVQVSPSCAPAFATPENGRLHPSDVVRVMGDLLEEDMFFEGTSRIFDVIEWHFPTEPGRSWVGSDGRPFETIRKLQEAGHSLETVTREGKEVPLRIRRKAADPKPVARGV